MDDDFGLYLLNTRMDADSLMDFEGESYFVNANNVSECPVAPNVDTGSRLNDDLRSPLKTGVKIPLNKEGVQSVSGDISIEDTVHAPYVGMEFDTLEMFDEFWNDHAREIGFSVRILYTHKSKGKKDKEMKLGKSYVCSRVGKKVEDKRRVNSKRRPETRCECPVKIVVGFNTENRKYYVKSFKGEHNHYLENDRSVYLLRSHRSITPFQARAIDLASRAGLGTAAMHRVMAVESGGTNRVCFTVQDIRSHLRSKRTRDLNSGEASAIIAYFDKQATHNPSFFYRFQFDSENKITNFLLG